MVAFNFRRLELPIEEPKVEESKLNRRISPDEFKTKLLEQNCIRNFISSKEREKSITSEERIIKEKCTFKPNLTATKKMNLRLHLDSPKDFTKPPSNLFQPASLSRRYESQYGLKSNIASPNLNIKSKFC